MKPDVETREDLIRIMNDFYSVALNDETIGHHFRDIDLDEHIPIVADFWEKALFGRPTYYRNTFGIHQSFHERNRMIPEHFVRWIAIFVDSVDRFFKGENAEAIKLRARTIADAMSLGLNREAN